MNNEHLHPEGRPFTKEEFVEKIKTDKNFADRFGDLGPVYGKQWRNWETYSTYQKIATYESRNGLYTYLKGNAIDQIANLINDLKTNPDSRRLLVNSWNVGELSEMVLPPCHYGFQVYTRELSLGERTQYKKERDGIARTFSSYTHQMLDNSNIPKRAISLMWNQRSVDTALGWPFNVASYGLLLELLGKMVNMVPDELIGNLGDCHIYTNQIDGCKEQIGRDLTLEERRAMVTQEMFNQIYTGGSPDSLSHSEIDQWGIPKRTREPYPLPKLNINTEWWPTESGECGIGPIDAMAVVRSFSDDNFCKCLLEEDIQLGKYQSHPKIVMPLSN